MKLADLFPRIITDKDPIPSIVEYLLEKLEPCIYLEDLNSTYEKVESKLCNFEELLHETWGKAFYKTLVAHENGLAIPKAFKKAADITANLLVCDGFSIRELLVLRKVFDDRLTYSIGRTPIPTTTPTTAAKIFNTSNLKEAFTGERLQEGVYWKGRVIDDIQDPPRLGTESGYMLLTQYPDSPLHQAVAHQTTKVQDVESVITKIIELIKSLSENVPLVVTGDHGYIYLGSNPLKFLWSGFKKSPRYDFDYGDNGLSIENISIALGRYHANISPGSSSYITHGGLSLTESIVPIVIIDSVK